MRIGIVVLCKTLGGPKIYGYNLVRALSSTGTKDEYVVLTDNVEDFKDVSNISPLLIKLKSLYSLAWWDYLSISNTARGLGLQLLHNTKSVLPFFISCRSIVTIHDMAPFLFPHTFPRSHRMYLQYSTARAGRKADLIITVSQNSKRDIMQLLNVNEDKIHVIYNGLDEDFKPVNDDTLRSVRQKYGIGEKVILYVGTLQPRKNVDLIIKAYSKLRKENKIEHQLVIAGRKGWMVRELDSLIDDLNLKEDVLFTGYIPRHELPSLYNLAEIFVYPSSYEGFGLSVLEAMACGIPVITTNKSSLPEIVGNAGVLLNDLHEETLAEAMWTLIGSDSLRQEYRERGIAKSKKFSWTKTAEDHLRVYHSIV
jgi:glycosyltransferase involved in cell wall biosynthesis